MSDKEIDNDSSPGISPTTKCPTVGKRWADDPSHSDDDSGGDHKALTMHLTQHHNIGGVSKHHDDNEEEERQKSANAVSAVIANAGDQKGQKELLQFDSQQGVVPLPLAVNTDDVHYFLHENDDGDESDNQKKRQEGTEHEEYVPSTTPTTTIVPETMAAVDLLDDQDRPGQVEVRQPPQQQHQQSRRPSATMHPGSYCCETRHRQEQGQPSWEENPQQQHPNNNPPQSPPPGYYYSQPQHQLQHHQHYSWANIANPRQQGHQQDQYRQPPYHQHPSAHLLPHVITFFRPDAFTNNGPRIAEEHITSVNHRHRHPEENAMVFQNHHHHGHSFAEEDRCISDYRRMCDDIAISVNPREVGRRVVKQCGIPPIISIAALKAKLERWLVDLGGPIYIARFDAEVKILFPSAVVAAWAKEHMDRDPYWWC